ncbi:retrovirus-related pol polyprotein from transposon TNT 1-94 [Tanacetum coccineum]
MNKFCNIKGIKREFSVARTLQQNRVTERKNRTLIEDARTMLADSKFPTTFWAEAVNTACYVQNKVLVIKPHNKTPYKLFLDRKPALSFMRPFGCLVTILNTIDHLGKFDGKADEGFFVGYSTNSKAFRVFNSRTMIVEENLHVQFCENTPNITGMQVQKHVIMQDSLDAGFKPSGEDEKKDAKDPRNEDSKVQSTKELRVNQEKDANVNSTNNINIVSLTDNATGIEDNAVDENIVYGCAEDPNMPNLEDIVYSDDDEDVGAEADMNNLDAFMPVSLILTIIDLNSEPQTRRMIKNVEEHVQALKDPSWIEAMQEKLLQFKLQEVWTLVELPNGKRAIGTKWVFRNKKDERGIVIKNKARLVAQGYTQEEGIDYDEVFASVARIEAIRLFLAYASFKDFMVSQMDVKSAFLYGKIEEEVYVCQSPSFEDPNFTDRRGKINKTLFIKRDKSDIMLVQVYVDDIIFGSTRKKMCTEFEKMMHKKFQMSSMEELTFFLGLQVKQKEDGIFISQDKLISWQCKKQTVVANSTTKAEYIAASNCCGQVLWIQNQLLDYGYNFMQTKIHIDNESTICIVKNLVFYPKTKHIEIRHHFIRDSNEKKLIQMIKIHTDQNVADLLTKAFDVSRFQYLIASIGMLNL